MENITIQSLMDNELFVTELAEAKTAQDVKTVFSRYGVEVSDSDAAEALSRIEDGELGEDELEQASGGIALSLALSSAGLLIAGGAAVSFLVGYAHQTYKNYKKSKKRR